MRDVVGKAGSDAGRRGFDGGSSFLGPWLRGRLLGGSSRLGLLLAVLFLDSVVGRPNDGVLSLS